MELVYAFTDEYGAFGWKLDNPTVSTHFIITAVIVKESDVSEYEEKAEAIRSKYFQTGEIKSQKVGANHERRLRILRDVLQLPASFFAVCIDKKACQENMTLKGLYFKESYYKFMNNIVHRELRRAFQRVIVVADEMGSNEYMQSFCKYVQSRQNMPNFLDGLSFGFQDSKNDVRIQIADFISGTLAYVYDEHKRDKTAPNYGKILEKKTSVLLYPQTYNTYVFEDRVGSEFDDTIAKLCFAQAVKFIETNSASTEPETNAQVIVLQYLLYRFMNNDTRGYIYTSELKERLEYTGLGKMPDSTFRMRIIGKLRDKGVIIASSQKGYKIPSKQSELYDYINHDAKIVIPMLSRLKKCRDIVRLATANGLDVLDHTEYKDLKRFFDNLTIGIEDS